MKERLEDLKKQLRRAEEQLKTRLGESNTFNLLKEKYEALSVSRQKAIKYTLLGLFLFVVFLIPLFHLTSSFSNWSEFKTKRRLSLKLLKLRTHPAPFQSSSSFPVFKQKAEGLVKQYAKEDYSIKRNANGTKNKKSPVKMQTLEIRVPRLNIKQVIELGAKLNRLPSARLESLAVTENTQYSLHYDTVYELTQYSMGSQPRVRPPQRVERSRQNKNQKTNNRTNRKRNRETNKRTNNRTNREIQPPQPKKK